MSAPHAELTIEALTRPGLRGSVRLLGGPGTGKTTALVETAAAHLAAGREAESVLLLTGSSRLSAQARASITAKVLAAGEQTVIREPLVRTVHSYAFAVLRLAAQRSGGAPPRLITSAEQDGIIRELLAGDVEDGDASPVRWPQRLRPALSTVGFATELRDLMARCSERGVDPVALQRLGRRAQRPEWQAAGRFAQAYEQIMLLRTAVGAAAPQATVPALGAAELVGAALEALAADADLLAAERARVQLLLVDDAQHLDPQAARLVQILAAGAELSVIAGDPTQAVFGYRGADPALLRGDGPAITLTQSRRCSAPVARAVETLTRRLPGVDSMQALTGTDAAGAVSVRIAASAHAECAVIADTLRRAHLIDGVPWADMAVIVRSVPRMGPAVTRALTAAGVPVDRLQSDTPLAAVPAVRALMTVLEATVDGLTAERALALVTGPIGRVDPVSLRQLRRALRRLSADPGADSGHLLVAALDGRGPARSADGVPDELGRALRRVRTVLSAACESARRTEDPRHTLWQAWNRSGLQRRWLAASERGGPVGEQADRDLDAITALFDVAEQYVERTAGVSVRGLVDHVAGLTLPPASSDRTPADAVTVLSAHAALGREWDVVVIAGLQEGLWPNVAARGGVLATQQLVDVLDGVADPAERTLSGRAPLLAEERRLLIAAAGRARSRLLVTAVDSDSGDAALLPSPFCHELAAVATESHAGPQEPVRAPRVLAANAVVGRLRSVVCASSDDVADEHRICAATQLARLAGAGVHGAAPQTWYGLREVSVDAPLWDRDGDAVTLSPSTVQMLLDCPLRWLLERHGAGSARDVRSALGSLVHALVADPTVSEEHLHTELRRIWSALPFDAQWHADNELDRHQEMLSTFTRWRADTRNRFTEVGTEIAVDGEVVAGGEDQPAVRIRGRLDRLERDSEGRLVVVDIKTGKSPATKDDAQAHAQLAMYQLAVAEGLLAEGAEPGGGRLVYLGKTSGGGATEREQDALTPDGLSHWRAQVSQAAASTQGPEFVARVNDGCAHCPVAALCPARQTTNEER
ncbi:ATP-dependent helicase [Mycolicibacterium sp. 018/SC-01/001]|uniref:ATP-dependent helicase n=1 Tax=Mycolicibacterium sp. 018/SC-01/001 TaxID=2592069 RepID=UPI00117EFAA8|nr:ATP-dependent DNA helicase [Mycolicibacterium sp. 018/SC-01/001]TRW81163.1 ATP-dependent helicase [Mycolicibacterium sp. 018/SC-01/001]